MLNRIYQSGILFISLMVFWISILCSGCAYIHVKTPLDINLDQTRLGNKQGSASAHSLFWLVAWGDASYAKAAQNGNLQVMNHADQETFLLLFGLYVRQTTIVYGE